MGGLFKISSLCWVWLGCSKRLRQSLSACLLDERGSVRKKYRKLWLAGRARRLRLGSLGTERRATLAGRGLLSAGLERVGEGLGLAPWVNEDPRLPGSVQRPERPPQHARLSLFLACLALPLSSAALLVLRGRKAALQTTFGLRAGEPSPENCGSPTGGGARGELRGSQPRGRAAFSLRMSPPR